MQKKGESHHDQDQDQDQTQGQDGVVKEDDGEVMWMMPGQHWAGGKLEKEQG